MRSSTASGKHLVMVSGQAPPLIDGVGDCTANLIAELARQRPEWRWTWLSRRPRWFHAPQVRCEGYSLIRPVHTWIGPSARLACLTLKRLRPSLVHFQEQIHSFFESDSAVRMADSVNCPVVTTLHEYHVELPSVVHTTDLVQRSSRIIANDARNAVRCLQESGREVDALWWSGNTVPPPDPAWKVERQPGLVATFGFLNALKSLNTVFSALETLRSEERDDLNWRVVGPFSPETNPAHAELASAMSQPWVQFTGGARATDRSLRTRLAEASVMALPYADGASMRRTTLQAAWALGIPVVTTPPPYPESAIVDGENCLLVPVDDEQAWASAIRRILTQPELADRLRNGGLEAARQHSWTELARRHLKLYDELLETNTPPQSRRLQSADRSRS